MTRRQEYAYFTLWRQACLAQGWDPNDSAKRHEVHQQVFGYDLSHKAMDNQHTDHIFRALRFLADDTDLEAVLFFQDPDKEERKRLVWSLQHMAAELYIKAIAADRFGTIYWQDLDVRQLTWLRNTVHNRMRAKHGREATAAAAQAPEPEGELVGAESNCPF
jgi:hypothetical protein